jgi:methyl coenzyme M reductase gamma subunit
MNIEELIADLRSRVNPQYYDQVGTESYERHQVVKALESLMARIEVLRIENKALRADADRIDWLADVNNTVGSVVLPREVVEANVSSLRQAIDAARSAKITQEPSP